MSEIRPTVSSFVVRNTSNKIIKVLGRTPVNPGAVIDLFKGVPDLSEMTLIDSLRAPSGYLYREIYVNKNLAVIGYNLMFLNSLQVTLNNLETANQAVAGQVLSVDDNNQLKWVFGDMAARLQYEPPIIHDGEKVSLPMADAFTSGYLSKEDWIIFKGKSKGLRVWQYQDVTGPFSNPVKLSNFENGRDLSFNANLIVDGTAVAVNASTGNEPPKVKPGLMGMFSNKVSVSQHVRDTVFLNEVPGGEQTIRIYFLIILPDGVNVPTDYSPPTEYVRKARIEYFDAIDIDSGGAKSIFGEKAFNDRVVIRDSLAIGKDASDAKLSVSGSLAADTAQIKQGAANGYTLTSNAVGNATWLPSPIIDSSPPVHSYNGRVWVKTPEYTSFIYDGNRQKWIAQETFSVDGGKNATSCANTYMNGLDNIPHNVNSIVLPYDVVLVGMMATGEQKQSWIAEVHVKSRLMKDAILHVVNSDRSSNMNLNVDLRAGDKVQLFASGTGIVMPHIRAVFKQRI